MLSARGGATRCLPGDSRESLPRLDLTRVVLCRDYAELTGSRLILLLLLQKGWVGCYPSCQNLCPKSTKPHARPGPSTRAYVFVELFMRFGFQIEFHEQSFDTATFKNKSEDPYVSPKWI